MTHNGLRGSSGRQPSWARRGGVPLLVQPFGNSFIIHESPDYFNLRCTRRAGRHCDNILGGAVRTYEIAMGSVVYDLSADPSGESLHAHITATRCFDKNETITDAAFDLGRRIDSHVLGAEIFPERGDLPIGTAHNYSISLHISSVRPHGSGQRREHACMAVTDHPCRSALTATSCGRQPVPSGDSALPLEPFQNLW